MGKLESGKTYPLTHDQYQKIFERLRPRKSIGESDSDEEGIGIQSTGYKYENPTGKKSTEVHLGEEGTKGRVLLQRQMVVNGLDKKTEEELFEILKGKTE